jgi:TolB protein
MSPLDVRPMDMAKAATACGRRVLCLMLLVSCPGCGQPADGPSDADCTSDVLDGAEDDGDPAEAWDAEEGDGEPEITGGTLPIGLEGSLQNPCWSPDDEKLVITRWRDGCNRGLADLVLIDARTAEATLLTTAEAMNVNLPGSCWDAASGLIVYTSDELDRDEVWLVPSGGGPPVRVTDRPGQVAFEPSFAPDGQWIVFESHPEGTDGDGSLWKVRADGSDLTQLTSGDGDDRQPNWSARGDLIVFQSLRSGQWRIWTIGIDGADPSLVTSGDGTDASFSPDGAFIVFSSDEELELANLFVIPSAGGSAVRVRVSDTYDGAPSWSRSGLWIAFETCAGFPDDSPGTQISITAAPPL